MKQKAGIWIAVIVMALAVPVFVTALSSQPVIRQHGWKTPVTEENWSADPAELHLDGAPNSILGLTLEQMITDPDIQIRADALCMDCHDWAQESTKEDFCGRVDAFMTTDQGGDGPKPQVLKDILLDWKNRNCPD